MRAGLRGRGRSAASRSARRSATAIWPASAAAASTSPPDELAADVLYQLGALDACARAAGHRGALREAARRALQHRRRRPGAGRRGRRGGRRLRPRRCRCSACPARRSPRPPRAAGVPFVAEAFADRAYTAGRPARAAQRARRGASTTPTTVVAQAVALAPRPARHAPSTAPRRRSRPRSLCLHGDTPGAVAHGPRRAGRADRRRRRRWRRSRHEGARRTASTRCSPSSTTRALVPPLRGRAGRPSPACSTPSPARARCSSSFEPRRGSARCAPRSSGERRRRRAGATPPIGRCRRCVYDGADLAEVAAEVGLSRRRASSRCTAAPSTSCVLRLLPRLRLPGRAGPGAARAAPRRAAHRRAGRRRSASPASSPASTRARSPGGWRLLGRTDATLWDARPRRRPALLAPGTRVRFVPAMIEIVEPGPLATVQDLGRTGLRRARRRRARAPSTAAARAAGQPAGRQRRRRRGRSSSPSAGSSLRVLDAATVALHRRARAPGADWGARGHLPAGHRRCGSARRARGLRSYLAVRGGLARRRRCSARAAPTCSAGSARRRCAPATGCRSGRAPADAAERRRRRPRRRRRDRCAVLPGPRADWFTADALDAADRDALDGARRVRPDRRAPRRPAAARGRDRRAAERADAARRGAGAGRRPSDRVRPGRAGDRRLPGDRRADRRRPRRRPRSCARATPSASVQSSDRVAGSTHISAATAPAAGIVSTQANDDVAGHAPAHRRQPPGRADAHDRRGDHVRRRHRQAVVRGARA